jgi:hypothetical protein
MFEPRLSRSVCCWLRYVGVFKYSLCWAKVLGAVSASVGFGLICFSFLGSAIALALLAFCLIPVLWTKLPVFPEFSLSLIGLGYVCELNCPSTGDKRDGVEPAFCSKTDDGIPESERFLWTPTVPLPFHTCLEIGSSWLGLLCRL